MVRASAIAVCLVGCLSAQQKTVYRFGTDPWIAWAPLHVAAAKGMFAAESVPIEITCFEGGETLTAFAAGKLDFVTVMLGTVIGAACRPVAPVVLAEIDWSHGGDKIVARAPIAPQSTRRIGIYEDTPAVTWFLHRYLAERTQYRIDQFELIEILDCDTLVQNFTAGRFDAIVCYDPHAKDALTAPKATQLATTADFAGVMPEVIATTRDRLARMPRAHVDGMLRAWIKACAWSTAPENRTEFEAIVRERMFPGTRPDRAAIAAMLANVRIHDLATLRARNAADGPLLATARAMLTFADRDDHRTVEQLVDTSALHRVLAGFPAETAATPGK